MFWPFSIYKEAKFKRVLRVQLLVDFLNLVLVASPVKLGNSKMKFINLEMLKLKAR